MKTQLSRSLAASWIKISLCAALAGACGDDIRPDDMLNDAAVDAPVLSDGPDASSTGDGGAKDGPVIDGGSSMDGALTDGQVSIDGASVDGLGVIDGGSDAEVDGALPPLGPKAVQLGSAANYVVLSKAGITATPGTKIVGNIGASPAAESDITGFDQARAATNDFSTSALVTGRIEASNHAVPTPEKIAKAIFDLEAAFTDAAGRTLPNFTELGAGNISGLTLVPGLYKWGTGVLVTTSVTLAGGADDVWIFQIAKGLTMGNDVEVKLIGGARANNVFWQAEEDVLLGTDVKMKGNILTKTQVVLQTRASLEGRALAQTAVTLDANMVKAP